MCPRAMCQQVFLSLPTGAAALIDLVTNVPHEGKLHPQSGRSFTV
jgi:hypothetical protein